jgi:hypothetical protein
MFGDFYNPKDEKGRTSWATDDYPTFRIKQRSIPSFIHEIGTPSVLVISLLLSFIHFPIPFLK